MGQKFTITEQERKHIKGLYEQESSSPTSFTIVKIGMNPTGMSKLNGLINIDGENLNFKQEYGSAKSDDTVKIVDKMDTPGFSSVYNCVGKIGMNDKHTFTILYKEHIIKWESISSFNGRSIVVWLKYS